MRNRIIGATALFLFAFTFALTFSAAAPPVGAAPCGQCDCYAYCPCPHGYYWGDLSAGKCRSNCYMLLPYNCIDQCPRYDDTVGC